MESTANKTILKNTLFLFFRMFALMLIGLYTSRVLLATLGVVDYGLYNVVGGVIILTNVLTGSVSSAAIRYLTYYMGLGNFDKLKQLFSNLLSIYLLLAFVILLFGETVGLWLVETKLTIPEDRFNACMWVYQLSIIAAIIKVLSLPYNSAIIAHEKMAAFAYIAIVDVILKLLIVFVVMYMPFDKLIVYAVLIMIVHIFNQMIYGIYCARHFDEVIVKPAYDKEMFKKISSYSGWIIFGALGYMGYTQGLNILLNMFFGPTVNAARALSVQVESKARNFTENFQVAAKPQVIKNYAAGDFMRVRDLVLMSSKFSFFLVLVMAIPICIESRQILGWWLVEVPKWTAEFVMITFGIISIRVLAEPLFQVIHANGNLKKFQLLEGGTLMMILPVGYVLLKFFHVSPIVPYFALLAFECIAQCIRMYFALSYAKIKFGDYVKNGLLPICKVGLLSLLLSLLLKSYLGQSIISSITVIFSSIVVVLICSYFMGCSQHERMVAQDKLQKVYRKFFH